jgi:hypothetical protein
MTMDYLPPPEGQCTREISAASFRQRRYARRGNTLKPGLTIVVRLTRPGALADLQIATMGEALHVGLARERHGRGLRRWRTGRGGRDARGSGHRRAGWIRRGCGIARLRRIRRLLCGVPLGRRLRGITGRRLLRRIALRLLRIGLLPRGLRVARVLPGLCGGGLLVGLAAGRDEAAQHDGEGGDTKHRFSHVTHTSAGRGP